MRLIDADALANAIVSVYGADGLTEDASLIYGLLLNRPTIEVVLCMDGKGTIIISVRENGEILKEEVFDYCEREER